MMADDIKNKKSEAFVKSGTVMMNVSDLTPHPENHLIYDRDDKSYENLRRDIRLQGILNPLNISVRGNGVNRILSGHRRVEIAIEDSIEQVECKLHFGLSDFEEMLVVYGCNIGRDMKEAYKARFFKAIKQFLRQKKSGVENSDTYIGDEAQQNFLVEITTGKGIDLSKMKIWEAIESIIGFTEYEQKLLTKICDETYRSGVLVDLKKVGVKKNAIEQLAENWAAMENSVLSGETTIAEIGKEVSKLTKQIEILKNPPKGAIKAIEKPKAQAPVIKEKTTEKNASMYSNTISNAVAYLSDDEKTIDSIEELAEYLYKDRLQDSMDAEERMKLRTELLQGVRLSVAALMQDWARLAIDNQ